MWQNPFLTWDIVVDPSSRHCNLVLGWFLAIWVGSLSYAGSCRGPGLGDGSILRNFSAGVLLLCGTLGSGWCLDFPGMSTLGTFCASPCSGVTVSTGASVVVACLKILTRALIAAVFLSQICANGTSGAGF